MEPMDVPFNSLRYKGIFAANQSAFAVKFNPFQKDIFALACAENFGLAGSGSLQVLRATRGKPISTVALFEEDRGIMDCSWNEENENLVAIAIKNGVVKLIDTVQKKAISIIQTNSSQLTSIEFSHKNPPLCLTSGFENHVGLIDFKEKKVISNFKTEHKRNINQATWHPNNDKLFASCASDGSLTIWDFTQPKSVMSVPGHNADILGCDFNKYVDQIITASHDKTMRLWDFRKSNKPVKEFRGHRHPVKKVKFSPHEGSLVITASQDMDVGVWDVNDEMYPLKFLFKNHTEFVSGIDFNLYIKRQIASCGWDGRVLVWNWDQPQPNVQ